MLIMRCVFHFEEYVFICTEDTSFLYVLQVGVSTPELVHEESLFY